ncbi:hypothetical protein K432DRAFT_313471 [Lepidopterella palustris CBS 459.81]|uniref:SnoaL-like domain-containing protein n=1 Tax=Lepidopterella palustris CBS 459.81 TaxID=1314670 RepID=A0A8E2J8F2_9PEZI|nr:hypothetical protein K432DRAFT_313471 [Lepidopterella palustris CBS 459.81]
MSPTREQLLKTAKAYLDAHEKRDINALRAVYSLACKHHNFPEPVKPIFPDVSFEGYLVGVADLFKIWHSFECRQFAEPVVDSEARKVVLFIEGKGEADVGTYVNEYVVVLMMNEAGTLIEERLQFFDSQGLLTWVARMGQQAQDLQDKVKDSKAEKMEA